MILKMELTLELKEAKLMDFVKRLIIRDLIGAIGRSVLENELVKVSVDKIEEV